MKEAVSSRTRVWRTGVGPKMILLHGEFGDARTYWGPIVEAVAGHFDLILPDLPRFGESAPLADDGLPTYLSWLKQLADALEPDPVPEPSGRAQILPRREQSKKIVLGGAGFGALLARLFAARYPDQVGRLILTGGGTIENRRPRRGLIARLAGAAWPGAFHGTPSAARDLFYDPDHHCSAEIARAFHQTRPAAGRILRAVHEAPLPAALTPVCTTLLLWGNEDRYCPLAVQQAIADELPDQRQVAIFEAAHMVAVEQPHRYRSHLLDFALSTG